MKRNKKLVNVRFQLSAAIKISAFSLSAFVVISLILGMLSFRNSHEIVTNMTELEKAVTVEKNLVKAFTVFARRVEGNGLSLYSNKIFSDHEESMKTIDRFVDLTKTIAFQNYITLAAIIVVGLVQIIALFVFMIRFTHRVSGPEYVLEKHLDDMLSGREPDFRPLRDKDALAGIYDRVQRLHKMMKTR